jgi:integrase
MAYGSGSLYRRDSVWWMQWYELGRRCRESTGKMNRGEALTALQAKMATIPRGGRIETVGHCLGLVLEDYRRQRRSSAYDLDVRLKATILPYWAEIPLPKVNKTVVDKYVDRRRSQGAADSTINRELASVRRGIRLAQQLGAIAFAVPIPILRLTNARQGFLAPSSYKSILTSLPAHLKCIFVLGYHLGCRKGELLQLRKNQVNLESGQIRLEPKQTKTSEGRTVPIYGDMCGYLESQMATAGPWLHPDESGKSHVQSFRKSWLTACTAAGVPELLFHDLRRTAVRNMERAGIPRHIAMAITGHKTQSVYQRYDIINEKDLQDAGMRLDSHIKATAASDGRL